MLNVYPLGLIRKKYFKLSFIIQVFNSCSDIYRIPLVENNVQEATRTGPVFL